MRKRLWLIVSAAVAVVAALCLLVAAGRRRSSTVEAAPGPPSAQVAVVHQGSIDQVLTLAGQFQPYQVIDIHPKVNGFIRRIFVDIGDRVHQGQTLAILEVPELKAQLAGTVSEVAQANDEITRAQHEVQRAQSMHAALHAQYQRLADTEKAQPGLIAQQELDDAQAKDLSSQADVDAAKAALAAAEKGLQVAHANNQRVGAIEGYTRVVAPLDGVIIWRYADTGALIQSGVNSNEQDLPIVKLAQSGVLRLRLPVPEAYVRYVHLGDPVNVHVSALNRNFTGKVVRFTRDLNFETRTMQTEIDVPNRDLSIDSGEYADAMMRLNHADNVPTVPADAIVRDKDQRRVYVLDANNRVHFRDVKIGVRGTRLVQIESGLEPGDRVILGSQMKYAEGEKVTPVVADTPASETAPESGGVIDMNEDASNGDGGNQ